MGKITLALKRPEIIHKIYKNIYAPIFILKYLAYFYVVVLNLFYQEISSSNGHLTRET